ncbi:hypothetical protein KR018_002651 [Drosophila ironensis]|nr:hypothetical protein KR018_002651 [Drosophila ironensis]
MEGGPEFSWEYSSHGGNRGGSNYPQMGRPSGDGRQWLHSNQATNFNANMNGQVPSPENPFAGYNASVLNQYSNYKPNYGSSAVGPMTNGDGQGRGFSSMGAPSYVSQQRERNSDMGGYMGESSMQRTGPMRSRNSRIPGSFNGRNGLNEHNVGQRHQGSWF